MSILVSFNALRFLLTLNGKHSVLSPRLGIGVYQCRAFQQNRQARAARFCSGAIDALWFIVLLNHCSSSPCVSNSAVPRRISQSSVGSALCGSSPYLITAFYHHVARSLRFLAASPSFALHDHCVSTPCGSILRLHVGSPAPCDLFQFSALWFFALPDHCVSLPCSLINAVPCWISFSAIDHCGSSLDYLEHPAIQCPVFILLPVQCSLVYRPWIYFSALRFSVLCVSLLRVVVNFPEKPIRLGLNEDLFHYGERACSQEQRIATSGATSGATSSET